MIKIAVLYGHGLNCDRETKYALEKTTEIMGEENIRVQRVHISEFIGKTHQLQEFQMLTIPGGFLHGDDISAGKILANKLKTTLSHELEEFIQDRKLILGICNGFQVLVKYALLPVHGRQKVTLTYNDSGRFEDRWTWVKVTQHISPFLRGLNKLYLPIRHAEGKFTAPQPVLEKIEGNNQIALEYCKENGDPANGEFPYNPNGSLRDVAGICDRTGRILGLMPHPEAFISYFNRPNWDVIKRKKTIPRVGNGLKIFKNAIKFLTNNWD